MSDSENLNNKVISLNNYRNQKTSVARKQIAPNNLGSEEPFSQAIKKNKEQKEKIKVERMKANKQVLKSYNIKK